MAQKYEKYSAKEEPEDAMELLNDKLASDLRRSIRQLENFPILSDPWFEMADIFGRLATVSDMESKLPCTKTDATLWETEEQALRWLLEDGKLNLCLRCLIEFKSCQIKTRKIGKGPMIEFLNECDKFERGIGSVFKNAWEHVEVLQTTDLPCLIIHIADTLQGALESFDIIYRLMQEGDLHQRQEVLVYYYLYGMLRQVEEIKEHRIMPLIRERRVFILSCQLLSKFSKANLLTAHKLKAAQALALLTETEDFSTHTGQYYSADDTTVLIELREGLLSELMRDFTNRKLIRPLVDSIDRAKRKLLMSRK